MREWRGPAEEPPGWSRTVVTIGVFDGVHRGHQRLIRTTVALAAERAARSVVLTFDPHPVAVLRPEARPAVLTPPDRRAELIADLGVDGLCTWEFTPQVSRMTPADFARDVLVGHLRAAAVVVGPDFRFGDRAAGDATTLRELGERHGFSVDVVTAVTDSAGGGEVISATSIRAAVADGDVARAAAGLGRPHRVTGPVVRGDQRGRELGFPTANLALPPDTAIPADGVYAGWAVRGGASLPAAVSVGTNPTFAGERERRVEAYLLDFDEDLYDERLGVDFHTRLRPTVAFDSVDALVAQMKRDVDEVRQTLG